MSEEYRTLSVLVYGDSKTGKTTLAATAPMPLLVLDAEGGWKFIPLSPVLTELNGKPLRPTYWNPMKEGPPRYDGTWDYCVVPVREWNTVKKTYEWITQSEHDFATVVIDSITEIQRRCKRNLVGTEGMKIQNWGTLLDYMDDVIRGFRDIANNPMIVTKCVVFTSETQERNGKHSPYMQGRIAGSLPYWMDIAGYLFAQQTVTDEGVLTSEIIRRLLIEPHDNYVAGNRTGRLSGIIDSPNITGMMAQIYGTTGEDETTIRNAIDNTTTKENA